MDITLWGEVESIEDIDKSSKNSEDKKNNILNSFEVPTLYEQHKIVKKDNKHSLILMKPPLDSMGQNHLMQSIELQHYKKNIQSMLAAAHSNPTEIQKGAIESQYLSAPLSAAPLPPKRFCSTEGHLIHSVGTNFLSTEFAAKEEKLINKMEDCPNLSALSLRQLLLKSIACIVAHTGFEIASESCLNLLTDIAVEHFMKLCSLLRERLEHSSLNSKQTVIDIIKLVFSEALMESLTSLQDYWLKSVKQVAVKLEKENVALLEEYNFLRDSPFKAVKEEINR
ncbi:uncharacterized protein LOC100211258 isoform X3 [Hydra vulgaris]|uniref:Uncharacterized protein LOC100211258 isoform X3 n=2 Tax=Hydra vulgaris TaxID=6087 RepID=A0ABM4BHV9_HYDVU